MKTAILFAPLLFLPLSLISQPTEPPHLTPGTWGGVLNYQNQSTEFYLDLRYDNEKNLVVYSYMPVIPFLKGLWEQ